MSGVYSIPARAVISEVLTSVDVKRRKQMNLEKILVLDTIYHIYMVMSITKKERDKK